jgi:hypothetical protein
VGKLPATTEGDRGPPGYRADLTPISDESRRLSGTNAWPQTKRNSHDENTDYPQYPPSWT